MIGKPSGSGRCASAGVIRASNGSSAAIRTRIRANRRELVASPATNPPLSTPDHEVPVLHLPRPLRPSAPGPYRECHRLLGVAGVAAGVGEVVGDQEAD